MVCIWFAIQIEIFSFHYLSGDKQPRLKKNNNYISAAASVYKHHIGEKHVPFLAAGTHWLLQNDQTLFMYVEFSLYSFTSIYTEDLMLQSLYFVAD